MQTVLTACTAVTAIAAAVSVAAKMMLLLHAVRKGQQCLLRQQMLEAYYDCRHSGTIRQYRYENFVLSYKAYKALGGNSFIDHIKDEVDKFEVIS